MLEIADTNSPPFQIASSHEMLEVLFPQMFVESKDVETRDVELSASSIISS